MTPKRLVVSGTFVAYGAFLIDVMVFRNVPVIRLGHLMLNFGGADADGTANFIPFKTILSYLLGYKGWIIASVNLVGNVGLLVPLGLLAPFVFRNLSWRKALAFAVLTGFLIEGMQVLFHTGIFDTDDVILNALGVMVGYGVCRILVKRIRTPKASRAAV